MMRSLGQLAIAMGFLVFAEKVYADSSGSCWYWGTSCCSAEPNDCLGNCNPNWEQGVWILKYVAMTQAGCTYDDV
ncbi:MAG: hypothetical protein ABR551_04640 [Gemmatimonadales bacterium]